VYTIYVDVWLQHQSPEVVLMDLLSNLDEKSWQNIEPEKIQGTASNKTYPNGT